jgi:phosphoenolpyruvate-protein kinase (PTS system EI component)
MAFALIGLGVRELSVAPRSVPMVKQIIRGVSAEIAREAAAAAVAADTAQAAYDALAERLSSAFGDAPFLRHGLPVVVDGHTFESSAGP